MTPTKKDVWNFPSLNDLFDNSRFISDFFGKANAMNLPAVNIKESEKHFEVELAVPGMKKENISIEMKDNMVTISGEKKEEHEEKDEKYHHREFSYGSFSRSFTIPEGVEADKIKANFDNGVLHLMIPKNHHIEAASNTKKISIA